MRKVFSALIAIALTLNCSLPVLAQSAPVDLDLSSTVRSAAPALLGGGNVPIVTGAGNQQVNGTSLLTPAEQLAVWQVMSTGTQSIKLNGSGAAIGGNFNLNPSLGTGLNSLVIPKGVTSLSTATNLNILGDLNNSGRLHVSPASNAAATISANNIINNLGALITSSSTLNLLAANNIINYGKITGTDNLSFTAGHSIINSGAAATMNAAGSINLIAGNILNSGLMTATAGNINISSLIASNILFNNTNGTLSALNGDINVRDAVFAGKYNFNMFGGDVLSNTLNIWSGNGNADLSVNNITSLINVTAGNVHIMADTANLQLGAITFNEDPTFFNTGGNITVNSAISAASNNIIPGVAIVASGDVLSAAGGSINTNDTGSTNGFPVIVVAGANFTVSPSSAQGSLNTGSQGTPAGAGDTTSVLTLIGPSSTGGKIDLSALSSFSTAGSGNTGRGGSVTLAAFAGTGASSGTVNVGNIATNSDINSLNNGNITIIAGAKSDPSGGTAITTGSLTTDTKGAPSGGVLLVTGNPVITGGQFQIQNGAVIGLNSQIASASLGTSSINPGASITTGAITTNTAPVMLVAGSNVTLNGNITTQGVSAGSVATSPPSTIPPGPGGDVTIVAGGNIHGSVVTISTVGSTGDNTTIASNAGGDVRLIAGANASVNVNHTWTGSGAGQTPSVNSDTIQTSLTVTGASASGGNINLTSLETIATTAGPTQVLAPVNNVATGGDVTMVAFAGAQAPTTTGQIVVQGSNPGAIVTGGSPINNLSGITADTDGTDVLQNVAGANAASLKVGDVITGPGILGGTTITNIALPSITLSQPTFATANGVAVVGGTPQSATNNANGNVTIIAGGQPGVGTTSIAFGTATNAFNIDTSGGNEGGGNITIQTGSPTAGLPFFYGYNSVTPLPANVSGSFSANSNTVPADITIMGGLTAVGGSFQVNSSETLTTDITVRSGGNLTIGTVSNTNNTLPVGGPAGALSSSTITLLAGSAMNLQGGVVSNAGAAIAGVTGADGGTINLTADSFVFPNGQQLIGADGTGGYTLISNPLNFSGTLANSSTSVTNMFTTIDGVGLVVGTPITDNAGNTLIPAGTTIAAIATQSTQANATLTAGSGAVMDIITEGLTAGTAVVGGSLPANTTIQSVNQPSLSFTGDTDPNTNVITNVPSVAGLAEGQVIAGPGIPIGATIAVGGIGANTVTFNGGNATSANTGATIYQAGQITLTTTDPQGFNNVVAGPIVLSAANGSITLNQPTTPTASGATPLTSLLPIGQQGGNGGTITITTTSASPIVVGASNFQISAKGDTTGGNGGTLNFTSGSSMSLDPAQITAQPFVNNLADAGFGTLITTGAGATFNLKAATTLFISGTLDASGAASTLSAGTGTPGGDGGTINIDVTSSQPFNIGGATAGPTANGLPTSAILSANGNGGTVSGFGSGGTINILNRGSGGIIAASGSLLVQAASATDTSNLGAAQQTYLGGNGGQLILTGQTVLSSGNLSADGGERSSVRGSGDGGLIQIVTNSSTALTVDPTAASATNGVIGTLNARGNTGSTAPGQGTILTTLPTGNGGTIILKNTGGGIVLGATAGMSVAAADASFKLGTIGGNGGTIELNSASTISSAIGLSANGGVELAPTAYIGPATVSDGFDVQITVPSTDGLFVGQTLTLQNSSGAAEAVLIKSVDSGTEFTVWQVVAAPSGAYSNPTLQTYFSSGNGGKINITTNSATQLSINPTTATANSIGDPLTANGFNGGSVFVTNKGAGGVSVAAGSITTTAIAPIDTVGTTLVGVSGFGGNISIQAPTGAVVVNGPLRVNGATTDTGQTVGANFGGIGGNLTIVSNSTKKFEVGAASGITNGVVGSLSANGGSGIGGQNNAGTITIVNLGTGGIKVNAPSNVSAISIIPGVKSDGVTHGTNGPPGNGGALTLTAPKGTVLFDGTNGIDMSGNTLHAGNQADGLGGSVSITTNSTAAFNIGFGGTPGVTNGTAGPIVANGWSGGSISITNLGAGGIALDNTSGTTLSVTANPANPLAVGSGGIHVFGGPGGTISLQAPKGPIGIVGNLDASGGAQHVDIGSSVFLQGGDGGQISIVTGVAANNFTIGGTAGDANGISGTLSANGANGGIVNVSAVNGADISVTSAASISVAGYPGITCIQCNNDVPLGNPPTDFSVPGGNGGKIYLQAPTTGGTVFISGTATTGGLSVAGASAGTSPDAGPHAGNGGTIVIVSNSTTSLNIGAGTTNGLGTGGSILDASGYNGGTIAIENLGGSLYFNPHLISVSSAPGAVATEFDLPGGNGGIIDLQAPKGKLGATVQGTLRADATASTAGSPQLTASGGTITLNALQIDQSLANLTLSANGANASSYFGKGGTVIVSQSTSTAAQALKAGQSSSLNISVVGSPGANLGGTITLSSPAGIALSGNLSSDNASSGTINLLAAGKNSITQTSGTIKTGILNLTVGDQGDGPGNEINTAADSLTIIGSGAFAVNNTGNLVVTSAFMHKGASLGVYVNQGNLTVNTLSSTGTVTLSAAGAESVADTGNITITGNVIAGTASLTATSGDGSTGGGILGTGSGLLSAKSITLAPEMGGVNLNTSTGLLTINNNISSNSIIVNNTGNLFLSLGTSSSINSLVINNVGSITTLGALTGAAAVTLDNVPGTAISGSLTAGSNVLNTTDINSLVIGAPLQGIGLPAGTTVGTIGSSVYFTGDSESGSNIINSITVNGGTGGIAPGATVTSPSLPDGTTITSVVPQFGLPGQTNAGSTIINNVPPSNAQAGVLPGVSITGTGIPANTTISSAQSQQFGFQGTTNGTDNKISNVPDTTQGLVVGAAVIGQTGIPSNTVITAVGTPSGGFVEITVSNTITTPHTNVIFTVPPYIEISQPATSTAANTYTVPSYALVSATAVSTGTGEAFNQASYVTLSNAATATVSGASMKQLSGPTQISGNSSSITLAANVGQGATNNASSVIINAGGSIIQNAGVITANSVLLTSQNGNIGMLTRNFTNNIYTPAGTAINLDIAPAASSNPGNLAILTSNTVDNSSAGTINVSIAQSTINSTGSANLLFVQGGGDVLITSNLGSGGNLTVANPVTSAFGAITLLNSNSADGVITVNSNISAGGGPLTIQNNNNSGSGATIVLSSTASTPITLSGVGWLVNGLGAANMVNSASTSGTPPAIPGLQTGVALITGAFPAPPLTSDGNPGFITENTTTTGTLATTVTFGASGSITGATPNTVVNATGASVVFQGAAGAIELGDSAIINAPGSALVITSLDLTDPNVVSNLNALSVAGSGITVSGNTFTFDPTTATIPFTLANLSEMNIKTGSTVNFNNFTSANPVAVNVVSPNKNVLVTGTLAFNNTVANTLDSDGRLFFNSAVVGQVLTVAGTISSNNNITINAGGSVTVSTAINAGTNGSLNLFTGAANLFDTTPSATNAPPGTLTLSSASLTAGQSNGSILVNAASIVSTSTSTVSASDVTLAVAGINWAVNPTTNAPIQIASSQISGIPTISTPSLLLNAASGATINLVGTSAFNVGNLSLNVANSKVTISQAPAISIAAQGLAFTASMTAGNFVLNTNNTNLVAGTLVQGTGLQAGTTITSVNSAVDFTGSIGANGAVITDVPDTVPLVLGAEVSGVGLPAGTIISDISPSVGGVVQVTLLFPGSSVSTTPVNASASFTQAPYAQLSNPADLTIANGNFQDFVFPGTLHTLSVTSTSTSAGGISTSANISCSSCTFKAPVLTNLNTISTNSPVGTITIAPASTTSTLSIIQSDGVYSGSLLANAGVSITAALGVTLTGGSITTAGGPLSVSQTGTGNLTLSATNLTAGTFNGIPLGPNILFTDVAAAGSISVQELGTGSLIVNDSASFHSIGQNISLLSTSGTVSLQGIFQADGGNVVILNSGTSLTATNSVFNANALGTTATNSVGGIVEIGAGTNVSQLNNLSTVPGTVPVAPLFNQPDGPAMPLGSNVAIDNNASGSSVYPTGAIMQNISGTGSINVGNSATAQTALNLLGGGIVFDASSASVLIDGSMFQTNGFTPLSAKTTVNNSLCIEMEDSESADKQAFAHIFTPGQPEALILTNHGFVNASKHASLPSGNSADYTMHSGSMFVEALSQTTIHTGFADIKAKKGALLALSHDAVGLRIAACSGPGQTTVHVAGHAIALSAGEEILISDKELTAEQRAKSDGIGRRNHRSANIKPHVWVSTCEVSIMGVLNHWKQCAIKEGKDAVARSLSGKMLKTAAALMVVTQNRGAYEARPYKAEPTTHFTPVRYRQTQSQSQAARNRLRASAEF